MTVSDLLQDDVRIRRNAGEGGRRVVDRVRRWAVSSARVDTGAGSMASLGGWGRVAGHAAGSGTGSGR